MTSTNKLLLYFSFKPLFDTSIHTNIQLRYRWIGSDSVQFVPIDLKQKWYTVHMPLKQITKQALAISCFVNNNVNNQFVSQQCIGSVVIPIDTIQSKEYIYLSNGIDIYIPTFEIQIDPQQSKLANKTLLNIITKQKRSSTTTWLEDNMSTFNSETLSIVKEVNMVFLRQMSVDPYTRWIRRGLRINSMIYDPREVHMWSGSMIPSLFTTLLQEIKSYPPAIQFYINHISLSLQETGLTPENLIGPSNRIVLGEILARTMCRTARSFVYGQDQIETSHELPTPNTTFDTKKMQWRSRYKILNLGKSNDQVMDRDQELELDYDSIIKTWIAQKGDQLSIPRLFPNPHLARIDCEDVALEIVILFYVLKLQLKDKFPSSSSLSSIIRELIQYTVVLCNCTMVSTQGRHKSQEELLQPDTYFTLEHEQKQQSNTIINSEDSNVFDDPNYIDHVTSIGLATNLFEWLIRKGRTYIFDRDHAKYDQPIVPTHVNLILEGTDTYSGCQILQDNTSFGTELLQDPYKLKEFTSLLVSSFRYSSMWSFKQPNSSTENCKRYAFVTCLYSGERVDDEYVGQVWFVNTKTHQYGIPMKDVMRTQYLAQSDWALIPFYKSNASTNNNSWIQQELTIPCYVCDEAYAMPIVATPSSILPIFLYCRVIDWEQYSIAFLEWVTTYSNQLQIGYWKDTFIVQQPIIDYKPECIILNQFQTVYRICILML